jgi:O-succinylbenzoic acid--CoA ligase
VLAAWAVGEAVAVLDPAAPPAVTGRLLDTLRPTDVVDGDGRRPHPGGVPAPPGVSAVVMTSGTTGTPKAVELTRAGIEAIGRGFASALDTGSADRWLVCLPLHHVAGLAILARSIAGGFAVTVHDGFDVAAVAASPERDGATIVSLVPTTLLRLLDAGAPVGRFRRVVVGGAPFASALRDRAQAAGVRAIDTYGLSETWGGVLLDGTPIDGAEVDVDDSGELLVRGPMVMRDYRFDAVSTAAALEPGGWLHTGDIGERQPDGRVLVVDRRRELIVTGGVNVSPNAVESVLARHRDVADVCVAGRPDPEWGERVVAFVVTRDPDRPPTVEGLREFARDHLSAAQLPREVVVVDQVPRSPGGKPLRRLLPDAG